MRSTFKLINNLTISYCPRTAAQWRRDFPVSSYRFTIEWFFNNLIFNYSRLFVLTKSKIALSSGLRGSPVLFINRMVSLRTLFFERKVVKMPFNNAINGISFLAFLNSISYSEMKWSIILSTNDVLISTLGMILFVMIISSSSVTESVSRFWSIYSVFRIAILSRLANLFTFVFSIFFDNYFLCYFSEVSIKLLFISEGGELS